MRISDWSSDVCSSDLLGEAPLQGRRPLLMAVALGLAAAQVGNAGERAGGDRRRQRGGEDEAGGEAAHEVAESGGGGDIRSEEHTSELQSLMRISYAVFCLKKKNKQKEYKEEVRKKKKNK